MNWGGSALRSGSALLREGRGGFVERAVGWTERRGTRLALVAVALSLTLAGGYAFLLGDTLRYYDEGEYVTLARSLAAGTGYSYDGVHPTAFRPPGYPFLLAPLAWVSGGSPAAMRLVGVAALAGSTWLSYLLGRRIHSAGAGVLAALSMACYPLIVYTATTLYPQVPSLFLLLAHLELGLRATPVGAETAGRRRWLAGLCSGLAAALLVLAVPTFAPSVLMIIGWLAWRQRRARARGPALRMVAVIAALTLLMPISWGVRNAIVLRALVPVSTNSGANLLLGNSDKVTAGGGRVGDISAFEHQARLLRLGEVDEDRYYRREAINWIATHPGRAAQLYVGKVANNFAYRNELVTGGERDAARDLLSALTFYPIVILALLRVLMHRRWRMHQIEWVAVALVVVNVLVQAVFFTRLRLRVPLDGLTILLAASFSWRLTVKYQSRSWSRSLSCASSDNRALGPRAGDNGRDPVTTRSK